MKVYHVEKGYVEGGSLISHQFGVLEAGRKFSQVICDNLSIFFFVRRIGNLVSDDTFWRLY